MDSSDGVVVCAVEDSVVIATLLCGQIRDHALVESVKTSLLQAIDSADARSIIINFQNVKFMSSMAFLALLAVRRRIGGGRVVLCELSPDVTEILLLCRLIPNPVGSPAPFEVALSMKDARERCGLQ